MAGVRFSFVVGLALLTSGCLAGEADDVDGRDPTAASDTGPVGLWRDTATLALPPPDSLDGGTMTTISVPADLTNMSFAFFLNTTATGPYAGNYWNSQPRMYFGALVERPTRSGHEPAARAGFEPVAGVALGPMEIVHVKVGPTITSPPGEWEFSLRGRGVNLQVELVMTAEVMASLRPDH